VYISGQFSGTVIFDGAGGHDSQTDAGGVSNAFLTSYTAFIPNVPSSGSTGSSVKAPNTSFGGPKASSTWQDITVIVSLPIVISILGYSYCVSRRRID
ncbi:MAG TPA: hypothetical protein VII94_02285, partial [Candidatus Saccharimonadales bacterium]